MQRLAASWHTWALVALASCALALTSPSRFVGGRVCNVTETREETTQRSVTVIEFEVQPFWCQRWPPVCLNKTLVRRTHTFTETRNITRATPVCCEGFRHEADPTSPSAIMCVPNCAPSDAQCGSANKRKDPRMASCQCPGRGFYNGFGSLKMINISETDFDPSCITRVDLGITSESVSEDPSFLWQKCISLWVNSEFGHKDQINKAIQDGSDQSMVNPHEKPIQDITADGPIQPYSSKQFQLCQWHRCTFHFSIRMAILFLLCTTSTFFCTLSLIAFCL